MARKKLVLWVWEGVLCDYTEGVAFAFAYDAEQARELILEKEPAATNGVVGIPRKVDKPEGFAVWGGG